MPFHQAVAAGPVREDSMGMPKTKASKHPKQIMNWFKEPIVPLKGVGDVSDK